MPQVPIVLVIGGGPAGMSCALWLHNAALSPIIIERERVLGGMAQRSPFPNEGFLGRPGETARENAAAFAKHVCHLGIEAWLGAVPVRVRHAPEHDFALDVQLPDASIHTLLAAVLVIATGTRFAGEEWLDRVRNAREWAKRGRVHVGAPWAGETGNDLGSHVAVIGGGDNAFDVAHMLVDKGVRATIVMRSQTPRAQSLMVDRLRRHENSGMARVIAGRAVKGLQGSHGQLTLHLDDESEFNADHVLLLFGYLPNSEASWMSDLPLARDARGYLKVDANMETSCRGVFAVGDIANPLHPCIATAVGNATKAAREIGRRLQRAVSGR
jgi:thioredoxin reductase (NADPH)